MRLLSLRGAGMWPWPAALLILSGCHRNAPAPKPATPAPIAVTVAPARAGEVPDATVCPAAVEPRNVIAVRPRVGGRLIAVLVQPGQVVTAGTPLAEIDSGAQQVALAATFKAVDAQKIAAAQAGQRLARMRALFDQKLLSRQDFDAAQATSDTAATQLATLEATVKQQQAALGDFQVEAPATGTVGAMAAAAGDRVTTATTLTTIAEPGSYEMDARVPVARQERLRPGLPIELLDPGGRTVAVAKLRSMEPQADVATQTVLVRADFPPGAGAVVTPLENNPASAAPAPPAPAAATPPADAPPATGRKGALGPAGSIPGFPLQARITWGEHQAVLVPAAAISETDQGSFLYTAEPQGGGFVAHRQPVTVAGQQGSDDVLSGGLAAGASVIVSAGQPLTEGAAISPSAPGR